MDAFDTFLLSYLMPKGSHGNYYIKPDKIIGLYGKSYIIPANKESEFYQKYADALKELEAIKKDPEKLKTVPYLANFHYGMGRKANSEVNRLIIDFDLKKYYNSEIEYNLDLQKNPDKRIVTESMVKGICAEVNKVVLRVTGKVQNIICNIRNKATYENKKTSKDTDYFLKDGLHIYPQNTFLDKRTTKYAYDECIKLLFNGKKALLREFDRESTLDTGVNINGGIQLYGSGKSNESVYTYYGTYDSSKNELIFNFPGYSEIVESTKNQEGFTKTEVIQEIKNIIENGSKLGNVINENKTKFEELKKNSSIPDYEYKMLKLAFESLGLKHNYNERMNITMMAASVSHQDSKVYELVKDWWIRTKKEDFDEGKIQSIWSSSVQGTQGTNETQGTIGGIHKPHRIYTTYKLLFDTLKKDLVNNPKLYERIMRSNYIGNLIRSSTNGSIAQLDIVGIMVDMLEDKWRTLVVDTKPVAYYCFNGNIWQLHNNTTFLTDFVEKELRKKLLPEATLVLQGIIVNKGNSGGDTNKESDLRDCIQSFINKIGTFSAQKALVDAFANNIKICEYDFYKKLNTNRYLFAFNNGVFDASKDTYETGGYTAGREADGETGKFIKKGYFRPGRPDDYISVQTDNPYIDNFVVGTTGTTGTTENDDSNQYNKITQETYNKVTKDILEFFTDIFPYKECKDCMILKDEVMYETGKCSKCGKEGIFVLRNYFINEISKLFVGNTTEEVFYMCQGGGQNGKTTLFELLALSFGNGKYYNTLPIEIFIRGSVRQANSHTAHLLDFMPPVRIGVASEPDIIHTLDAGIIKLLSGNEEINCRAPYAKQPEKFRIMIRLFMMMNREPNLDDFSTAMARRLKHIDFLTSFIRLSDNLDMAKKKFKYAKFRDPLIKDKCRYWAESGIFLTWLLSWYIENVRGKSDKEIPEPLIVKDGTEEYLRSRNYFAEFINTVLIQAPITNPPTELDLDTVYKKFNEYLKLRGKKVSINSSELRERIKQEFGNKSIKETGPSRFVLIGYQIKTDDVSTIFKK